MQAFFPSASKRRLAVTLIALILVGTPSLMQRSSAQQTSAEQAALTTPSPLIVQPVDESQLTVLHGNTHPLARPQFDLGTAPATLPMQRMLLVLKRSAQQEHTLRTLLDNQQDKHSSNYHQWLTPEQYGKQFGPTDTDIQTITSWLQSHGFEVGTTKGRTVLEFSGSASQVQEAFHTTIHKYIVNGEQHWANATDPQLPTALIPAVAGVASLNNFPRKAMNRLVGGFSRDKATGQVRPMTPLFTFNPGYECSADNYCFAIGPYDFATIYNVMPLWNSNINGTGQTIAIVGQSNVNPQDIANFRSLFGLPANSTTNGNPLNIILNGPDPGLRNDESEADIDVEWSGAVAPYATIDFVVSEFTETTSGVDLSAVYIVENNLAPVMSESYGECELGLGTAGNQFYNALWQQAAAQGITVFISSGDNGAAGCDPFGVPPPAPARFGLAVSGYASTPYNVAVGGTDFNEFTDPQAYWSTTNNSTTQASALGYIPETTWNNSCTNAIWETLNGLSQNPETNCNNPQLNDVVANGGSGGGSNCISPTGSTPANCAGGYPKPSWQAGSGVPNDHTRDLPDVSLFASNGFAGSFYIVCESDRSYGSCSSSSPDQNFLGFGGTSVSSPAFAGIMALVNEQTGSRQGNANYVFYKLAAKDTLSNCNASSQPAASCIFNDVTSGTIAMPCATSSPNCDTTISGDQYGILTGYNAGTGYDQATGLGSVNAKNLVTEWGSVTSLPSTTTLNSLTPTTITHGQPVSFSVTVKPESGTGTPTGEISLLGGPNNGTQGIAGFTLTNGTSSGTTDLLPGGTYSVTAHYPGDSTYAASDSTPTSVIVKKENSQPQVFLVTLDNNGNVVSSHTNTAVYGTPYVLRVNVENSAAALCAPVSATAATGCPSGTVSMTDNGAALDAGTYTLNNYGYFEDLIVQLPGGTDSVKAQYAGDNSFNASAATASMSITPAPTSMTPVVTAAAAPGYPFNIYTNIDTTSSGVGPTGTVSFFANGNPLSATTTLTAVAGTATSSASTSVSAIATLSSTGTYTFTATYGGDSNYAGSTAPASPTITVKYLPPNVIVTPAQQTISYGGTATVTALVDTTNKTVYPTGSVSFVNLNSGALVSGPMPCTKTTDSSGNFACQAVGTFPVIFSGPIGINYGGDANYPSSNSSAYIVMPDFGITLTPEAGITLTAGQSQTLTVTFTSQNGFAGTVGNMNCSNLPAETTCTFNSTRLTLPINGSASTTVTIATAALGQAQQHALNESRGSHGLIGSSMIVLGMCLIGAPFYRRRRQIIAVVTVVAISAVLLSCGGGGGGGGGGSSNPVPSISSLSPATVAAGSQVQSLYINGSNFLSSSTVTYNGALRNSSLQSPTQLQIAFAASDLATTGNYPVVVTNPSPGGGASAPVNFSVATGTPTGYFNATLNATTGPITNSTGLVVVVQ